MTDFIIVGRGLSAFVLAHTFRKHGLSFKIIGKPGLSTSSLVAAGIWNPIVFKRLLPSWMAHQTVPFLSDFYGAIAKQSGSAIMFPKPIVKPFMEEQEKQLWIKKSKNELAEFLGDVVQMRALTLSGCFAKGEAGLVRNSGVIDVPGFIKLSEDLFQENLHDEVFDHSCVEAKETAISYKTFSAKNMIFCEGHLVKNNRFFYWLPMKPAKGELLEIECPELELNNYVLNKGNFIFKSPGGTFKTGSTYNWTDLTDDSTAAGRDELENKLGGIISCSYNVLKQVSGVRPSTTDRRPVIGCHPAIANMFVFNGMGTKGVMLAPWFANNFVHFYLQKQALNGEADVKRFYHLYPGGN